MTAAVDHEAEGGDGYFASISDLMVGVLFIFLLMLTVFALNFRDAEDEQMVRLAELEAAQEEARQQKTLAEREAQRNQTLSQLLRDAVRQMEADLQRRQRLREQMLETLAETLRGNGVNVVIDPDSGVLRLAGDVLFATGEANYRDEARETVEILADVLAQTLPCFAVSIDSPPCGEDAAPILETMLVEGHTDRQPYRGLSASDSQARNDELSTGRALRVFATLRQRAPALDALRNADGLPLIGVSGYGERRPLADAQSDSANDYERNRRIDLRFVLSSRTSDELERLRTRIQQILDAAQ